MNRFNKVTNMVRSRPTGLEDWLFGCAHHRMTFPMTLRAGVGGGPRAQSETYIACLDCGRHFAYDCGRCAPPSGGSPGSIAHCRL